MVNQRGQSCQIQSSETPSRWCRAGKIPVRFPWKCPGTGPKTRSKSDAGAPATVQTTRSQQVSYFITRALEFAGALNHLNRATVITDDMLGIEPVLAMPRDRASGITAYGGPDNDQIAIRARAIAKVTGGGGDDRINLNAREIGSVRGNSGDDSHRAEFQRTPHHPPVNRRRP